MSCSSWFLPLACVKFVLGLDLMTSEDVTFSWWSILSFLILYNKRAIIAAIEIVPMTVPATIPPIAPLESEEFEVDIYSQLE